MILRIFSTYTERLEEEKERKRLEKEEKLAARKKSKEKIIPKPVERSNSPVSVPVQEKAGYPIPSQRPSQTLDSGYGGEIPTSQPVVQPQRPAKPERLSMYGQLSGEETMASSISLSL